MQNYIRIHKENMKAKDAENEGPDLKDILQMNAQKATEGGQNLTVVTEQQETLETKILETDLDEQPGKPIKRSKKFDPKDFVSKEFMIKKLEFDNQEAENVKQDEETYIKQYMAEIEAL